VEKPEQRLRQGVRWGENMPIQLRTDTSAAEHNLRKFWSLAPNPVHFADYTRFLRTTAVIATRMLGRKSSTLLAHSKSGVMDLTRALRISRLIGRYTA
jgi:hypothetical protein